MRDIAGGKVLFLGFNPSNLKRFCDFGSSASRIYVDLGSWIISHHNDRSIKTAWALFTWLSQITGIAAIEEGRGSSSSNSSSSSSTRIPFRHPPTTTSAHQHTNIRLFYFANVGSRRRLCKHHNKCVINVLERSLSHFASDGRSLTMGSLNDESTRIEKIP
jgi:hypothetical protein